MKKTIKYTVFLTLLIVSGYMLYSTIKRVKSKKRVEEGLNILPALPLVDLDSVAFHHDNLLENRPSFILYFNSECEHCQYEAKTIFQNVEKFSNANLLWVSYEDISMIKQFADTYNLTSYPNMHFTKIDLEDVMNTFGSLSIPHIFIYDKSRKLVKEFKGETKVEALLNWL